jgi:DNA/RNA-binding domain of Phe-tRNA-synthetase-like protein
MRIQVKWSSDVVARFPDLAVCVGIISGIRNEKSNNQLSQLKKRIYEDVRANHDVGTLKDNLTVRAYRDFYWKLNIDPTKTRPSGEALLRRVLNGNELPNISSAVDAYNLASMQTAVPISGFDRDLLNPPFHIRFAKNEAFIGIGMNKPILLNEKMLVLTDEKRVLCIYPYRDCDQTKITLDTRNAVMVGYGAPGITCEGLKESLEKTLEYIRCVSGGEVESPEVSRPADR